MLKLIYFKQIAFFIFSPSQKIHLCIIGSVLESTMAPNSNGGKERPRENNSGVGVACVDDPLWLGITTASKIQKPKSLLS